MVRLVAVMQNVVKWYASLTLNAARLNGIPFVRSRLVYYVISVKTHPNARGIWMRAVVLGQLIY